MATRRRWTEEEEDILVQAVQANPHNLSDCFRLVASRLNRTEKSVTLHWYMSLNVSRNPRVGTLFMTISNDSLYINRKNHFNGVHVRPIEYNEEQWERIKELLNIQ